MPGPTTPYPPAPPTVAGTDLTVSLFLRNPPYVQRMISDMTLRRFVADVIFSAGPEAVGGSVRYDQVTANQGLLDPARPLEEIEPGMEFPLLNGVEVGPLIAVAKKFGGEVYLTDEQVRRDNRGILGRRMTQLRNTIVQKYDAIAMAALRAAPIVTMTASGDWSTPATDIISDLATAKNAVTRLELGYMPDTVIIHDDQELDLLKDKDIRDALPRERDNGLIRTGNVGRLMGLDFIATSQVAPGEVFVLQRKQVGSISDEVPLYARPIPDERRERTFVHGARVGAAYVTDPKCCVRITGA